MSIFNAPVYDPYEVPTINHSNTCGWCGQKASVHPIVSNVPGMSCSRTLEEVGSTLTRNESEELGLDTVVDLNAYGMPIIRYDGPEVQGTRTDSATREGEVYDRWFTNPDASVDNIDRYYDKFPEEQTVTLDQYRNGQRTSLTAEQQRSVFIEGHDGFLTEKVYDVHLTELYHNRLLNIFTNKRGRVQIGSIELVKCVDGSIDARCVRNDCPGVLNTGTSELTRTEMEDFVLNIIRHGNNHAASWFVNRVQFGHRTFYKVHTDECNLTCDPSVAYCVPSRLTEADFAKLNAHFSHNS